MIAYAHLSLDGMRTTGTIQCGASPSTRLRGVGESAYAIDDIRASRQFAGVARLVGSEPRDSKQDQAGERSGAGIVKRGREQ